MNVTFRRDDGREFVFEMPDARILTMLGRAFLDEDGYKSYDKEELTLTTREPLAMGLRLGDVGQVVAPPDRMMKFAGLTKIDVSQRPSVAVTFSGTLLRDIPASEIREWLNP